MKKVRYALIDYGIKMPSRKNETDAGIDLYSNEPSFILKSLDMRLVRTGVTIEIPKGYMMLLKPKGRSNYLVGAGVIDAGYEPGEIMIKLSNPTEFSIPIPSGDPIAQGVLIKIETPELELVDIEELSTDSFRSGSGKILEQRSLPFKAFEEQE